MPDQIVEPNAASRRSKAVLDAFVSGAGAKLGSLAAQLIALAVAARTLGTSDLGVLVTLTAVAGILGFLDLGIGNAAINHFARIHSRGVEADLRRAVASALTLMIGMSVVISGAAAAVVLLMPAWSGRWAVLTFVVLSAIAIPASLGSRIALSAQRGRQNNLVLLIASVAVLSGAFAANVLSLRLLLLHVVVFIGLPVLANAVQTVLWLVLRYRPDWRGVDRASVVALLVPGLPFAGLALAGAAAYQTDAIVIVSVLGPAAAVGFGLLTRMFSGLTVLFMGGLQQLWASTAHALAAGDGAWVRRAFRRTALITLGLYVAADLVLLVVAPMVIKIWSDGRAVVSVGLVLAFVVWNTYNFAMSQFSMLLNGAGIVGRQAVAALAMAVVNLPLSILLTVTWGAQGPLWGSLLSHVATVGVPTVLWVTALLRPKPRSTTPPQRTIPVSELRAAR